MKPYPLELRQRIIAAVDQQQGSLAEIAARFCVSYNCVVAYLNLREETGSLRPRPNPGGRAPAIDPELHPQLLELLRQQPDLTLQQIRDRLDLKCSLAALCRTLKKLGLTRKKKTLYAAEQHRPDVQQQREEWAEWQAALTQPDLCTLVFWDETAVLTALTPTYGRAPAGQRVLDYVPHKDWQRLTLTAALRLDGVCATLAFEGGATVEACEAYAKHCLGPLLRPGDTVLMDRLSSHENERVHKAFAEYGAKVKMLPPYSPDLNPIEKAFSKLKTHLRQAKARTVEDLMQAIAAALKSITVADAKAWFAHCGYITDS